MLNRRKERMELNLFSCFLSDLCYEFYLCKSVTEAIYRAGEKVEGELKTRLEEINRILEEEESENALTDFRYPRHMKQLKLFLVLCRNAVQYGSGSNEDDSVFARNITELRRDVQNEEMKREQASFLFSGLGFIAAVPITFIRAVQDWGCTNMEQLQEFYAGLAGKSIAVAIGVVTVLCYLFLYLVREVDSRLYKRPFLLRRFYELGAIQWISSRMENHPAEQRARKRLLAAGIDRNGAEYYISCIVLGSVFSFGMLFVVFRESYKIAIPALVGAFAVGYLAMMITYRYLAYLKNLGVNGEVLGLQSIILMMFEAPNMTIGTLLETMEEYAVIFQRELLNCSDRYASEENEALKSLMAENLPQEFRRLAHRLYLSERLGLRRAFSELAEDRQFFREQQRMDTEHELKRRAINAQVVAFVPMFFLLFAYLIAPFLIASLKEMSEIFQEMSQMKM